MSRHHDALRFVLYLALISICQVQHMFCVLGSRACTIYSSLMRTQASSLCHCLRVELANVQMQETPVGGYYDHSGKVTYAVHLGEIDRNGGLRARTSPEHDNGYIGKVNSVPLIFFYLNAHPLHFSFPLNLSPLCEILKGQSTNRHTHSF